jgi:hypothetical protein
MPCISLTLDVAHATTLYAELRVSSRPDNHTPDVPLASLAVPLTAGAKQTLALPFAADIDRPRYAFLCLPANEHVAVHLSDQRLTGVLAVTHNANKAVAKSATQSPPPGIGIDTFEFWTPQRRPKGKNFAVTIAPPLDAFAVANVTNGVARPTRGPNAWVADFRDPAPTLTLRWDQPQTIARIELGFDCDFDHPLESVLMGHPERCLPFCVRHYRICDGQGHVLAEVNDNHQTRNTIHLPAPVTTRELTLACLASHGPSPAALFEVRCYGKDTP